MIARLLARRSNVRVAVRCGVVAILAAGAAAVAGIAAPDAQTRRMATCTPYAYTPVVDAGQRIGAAVGETSCQSGAPTWHYTIRLKNRAGNTLAESAGGPFSGSRLLGTDYVSCAGAYVHTFLYINVGGAGKSDTSGENSDCAY